MSQVSNSSEFRNLPTRASWWLRRHWERFFNRFRRSPQVGFVGQATYGLMAENEAARCQLNALADFAFYAGVGMKTALGMGQCRRITNDQ